MSSQDDHNFREGRFAGPARLFRFFLPISPASAAGPLCRNCSL